MPDNAHQALLNREEVKGQARNHYGAQLDLMEQIVNYGTGLIFRAYQSTDRSLSPSIVCNVLLKHVVQMLDATQVACKAGACPAAQLPARAALEASLAMQWMLDADPLYRARCFVVRDYRNRATWARRLIPGTADFVFWLEQCGRMGTDITQLAPDEMARIVGDLTNIEAHLKREELAPINEEYDRRRKTRWRDVDWWELSGAQSLAQVATRLERLTEYQVFYQTGSSAIHLSTHLSHFTVVEEGLAALKPIRHLEDLHDLVTNVVSTAMATYRTVLRHYRPLEVEALDRKYESEWREPFKKTKKAVYPRWDRREP
jgi:hypothetical protein